MPVFYLKYRPQKITELDLVAVREGLTKVLQKKEKPHAFLFCGPKGTGKTSAARIMAKAVNCERNKSVGEPCNQCDMCKSITAGAAVDIYEIDGASNRGIDNIRELRERIKLAPARAKKKVYIIDEVHMLTTEAFNALLKTLEEPPEHAVFVLCTTAVGKLPETIVSRCMRFNFKRATRGEIISALKRVVKGEKLRAEEKALDEIARAASGSFRDATKILEQASLADEKVTATQVKSILGQLEGYDPLDFLKLTVKREIKNCLLWIDAAIQEGVDLKILTQSLIESLRRLLLKKIGLKEESMGDGEAFEELSIEEIKNLIGLFNKAAKESSGAVVPQLPLEMAVIEWCESGERRPEPEKTKKEEVTFQESGSKEIVFSEIEKKWDQVLLGLRSMNHSVEALLKACQPASIAGDLLTVEVFYKFHKERLETANYKQMVERAFLNLFGKPLRLKWVLKEKKAKKRKTEENISGKKVGGDIIRAAEEIFGGKVD